MDNEQVTEAPVEKPDGLSQEEVNKLVGRVKAETADKTRRQVEAENAHLVTQQQMMSQRQDAPQSQNLSSPNVDNLRAEITESVKKDLQQQALSDYQTQQNAQMHQFATQYYSKIGAAKDDYDDYDSTIGALDHQQYGNIALLANDTPHTVDIMHQIAKNPEESYELEKKLRSQDPYDQQLAKVKFRKIVESIEQNKAAKENTSEVNAPLSRLKPGTAGTDSGVPNSIADFKKRFRG